MSPAEDHGGRQGARRNQHAKASQDGQPEKRSAVGSQGERGRHNGESTIEEIAGGEEKRLKGEAAAKSRRGPLKTTKNTKR